MLNIIRKLLFPFSIIYGFATVFRNWLYDLGLLRIYYPKVKTICIGNLSVGGTGKSPHTELLAKLLLKQNKTVAILSRGYGRNTSGFIKVEIDSLAIEIGDEPLQMRQNVSKNIDIYVCEDRKFGIEKILEEKPKIDFILLDDAFQHRKVRYTYNIILTESDAPFFKDYLLPFGNLRDSRKSAKRADLIIVTKCNPYTKQNFFVEKIKPYSTAKLAFSSIVYNSSLIHLSNGRHILIDSLKNSKCVVFTGIANPKPFIEHLKKHIKIHKHFQFSDHHFFTEYEIENIYRLAKSIEECNIIITTQKDVMRIKKMPFINEKPIYYLPIEIECNIPQFVLS